MKRNNAKKKKSLRWFILALIITLGTYSVFIVPDAVESYLPKISTISPQKTSFRQSVTGNGTIENLRQEDVILDAPVMIKSYLVNEGDRVSEGQIIGMVDKEGTIKAVTSVAAKYSGVDISMLESSLPTEIISPVSGVISKLSAKNTLIAQGSTIATIVEKDSLVLTIAINEKSISTVKVGQDVDIKGSAFKNGVYKGQVLQISPTARKQYVGTVQETVVDVIVSINNPDDNLRSGYTAQGVVFTQEKKELLTLPYSVICQDEKGEYVYVYEGGNSRRKDIETGLELADGAEIKMGILIDDQVITDPNSVSPNAVVIKK